jgi:transcriptional regulator with XRE-family HTH domain
MNRDHVHEGRNVQRFREMKSMTRDTLARLLGTNWTQIQVALLESSEEIDEQVLGQVAVLLGIKIEDLRCVYSNDMPGVYSGPGVAFDPVRKMMTLYEEKIALYERMLREKDELLGQLMGKI